jgi:hypothetical protein
MQTIAAIRRHLPVRAIAALASDYLCGQNAGVFMAARLGHWEQVAVMSDYWQTHYLTLYEACHGGHLELVHHLIAKGAFDWDRALEGACRGGHPAVAALMIDQGATNIDGGLYVACKHGQPETARLMIERGATNAPHCIEVACEQGHINIVRLMIDDIGVSNWQQYIRVALCHGRRDIVLLMFERDPSLAPKIDIPYGPVNVRIDFCGTCGRQKTATSVRWPPPAHPPSPGTLPGPHR